MREAVIVEAVRTPVGKGKPNGALAGVHAVDLFAHSIPGLPEAAEAEGVAAAIAANPDAARVMKGQKKIAKLRSASYSKRKEITAAIDDLRALQREYAGTYAATDDVIGLTCTSNVTASKL